MVDPLLDNPVYNALLSKDAHLGFASGHVRFFDEVVSPFAGFAEGYDNGFEDLYNVLPAGRRILYATRRAIVEPKGWQLVHQINGLQFLFKGKTIQRKDNLQLIPLDKQHVEEMVALATLTKPGPFNQRTIEFGNYFGVFDEGKLVAMTGQRLHIHNYSEVSAVCTHPDYEGRGFAAALTIHQVNLILTAGQIPFLHVRDDNERAIGLYERLGFVKNGPMNFYFLKRKP